ncbi:isochorismatase family protein [Amycolatopsis rifamycinica]|uniref:isochorismatase family protein n=1 Tax=Amycolatopsis rifamycinica TaxID=287986 RepID=UPI00190F0CBA
MRKVDGQSPRRSTATTRLQTNVCVEATARTALARNFEVAVPSGAVSTDGPALHEGALNSRRVLYAEVAPWRAPRARCGLGPCIHHAELRPRCGVLGRASRHRVT